MMQYSLQGILTRGLLIGGLAFGCVAGMTALRGESAPPVVSRPVAAKFAVVDFQKLIKAHHDYKNLSVLDNEISRLQTDLDGPGGPSAGQKDAVMRELKRAHDSLMGQFQAEVDVANRKMEGESAQMQATLEDMAKRMSTEIKSQVGELPKGPSQPQISHELSSKRTELTAQMQSYYNDLQLVGQRQVAARRLELERQADIKLAALKADLDKQLNESDQAELSQNQQIKVNLELQKIDAKTDDDRAKLDQQIQALKQDEADKHQAKARELDAQYQAARRTESAKVQSQLKDYQAKLSADAKAQVTKEQFRLLLGAGVPMPAEVQHQNAAASKDIAHIKQEQAQFKSQFEAKKNELEAQIKSDAAATKAQLSARQEYYKREWDKTQKQIIAKFQTGMGHLSKEETEHREHLKQELADLKAQRKRLYDSMEADLKSEVATLARKDGYPIVLGYYVVNTKCEDLTNKVLKEMGQ
ncbi:MAG: hypothetical protein ACYCW6_16195 [Candidatus Xenobia bacterium]